MKSLLLSAIVLIAAGCASSGDSGFRHLSDFYAVEEVDTTGMTDEEAALALRQAENKARLKKRIYEDRRRGKYNGQQGGSGRR